MTNDLAATVAALKDGDRVRATFVDKDTTHIIEGCVAVRNARVSLSVWFLRHASGSLPTDLTAVEVLAPELPPEPPVGSGVFHDGVLFVRTKSDDWWAPGKGDWSWAEIQPCVPAVPAYLLEDAVTEAQMAASTPPSTDEPDVPVGSFAVFRDTDSMVDAVYRWDNGKWSGWPWSHWTDLYGTPVAVIPAGGTA